MAGTPEQLVEKLRAWEAVGMSYAIHYFAEAAYDRSGIELFARKVIPALAG
jgi:alkanesulfonate monooxygenase SsuD/methylene tetrahydromethanopterin reductase-like flavin-dependent oxidoreductase (luciferase family)